MRLNRQRVLILCLLPTLCHASSGSDLLDLTLEELLDVTITSQRWEEKLQIAPLSVTALDATVLATWDITDITRLGAFVPGLVMGRSGYDPRPAMRGARTQQVENNDAVVSVYSDGIYRPRHAQAMMPFLDLERIEVMRGPQGTVFGRNSYGGTISIISKMPELRSNNVEVKTAVGDYDMRSLQAVSNVALGDRTAFRVSGRFEQHGPYVENVYDMDAGQRDRYGWLVRSQFYVEPVPKASILFKVEHWNQDANGNGAYGYKPLGVPVNPNTGLTNPAYDIIPRVGREESCGSNCGRYGAGLDLTATPGLDTAAAALDNPYQIASDFVSVQDIDELDFYAKFVYEANKFNLQLLAASMKFHDFRMEDADFSQYDSAASGYKLIQIRTR